jgi:hypothetical protein
VPYVTVRLPAASAEQFSIGEKDAPELEVAPVMTGPEPGHGAAVVWKHVQVGVLAQAGGGAEHAWPVHPSMVGTLARHTCPGLHALAPHANWPAVGTGGGAQAIPRTVPKQSGSEHVSTSPPASLHAATQV